MIQMLIHGTLNILAILMLKEVTNVLLGFWFKFNLLVLNM